MVLIEVSVYLSSNLSSDNYLIMLFEKLSLLFFDVQQDFREMKCSYEFFDLFDLCWMFLSHTISLLSLKLLDWMFLFYLNNMESDK